MKFFGRSRKVKSRTKQKANHPKLVLIRQIVLGVFLMSLVVAAGVAIWHVSRLESLTVSVVRVEGGETVSYQEIEKLVEAELSGAYYLLVPKRFVWTFPEDRLIERVAALDRVKSVSIEKISNQEMVLNFKEYQPIALWCEKDNPTNCYFLDSSGLAFAKAPSLEGGAFLRFFDTEITLEKNAEPFGVDFLKDSIGFAGRLEERVGLNIVAVERISDEDLVYYIAGGGELKVSTRLSKERTLDNLGTVLGTDKFSHIRAGNFQYIDLRYGNKVFVNEELAPTLESEGASSTAITTASTTEEEI